MSARSQQGLSAEAAGYFVVSLAAFRNCTMRADRDDTCDPCTGNGGDQKHHRSLSSAVSPKEIDRRALRIFGDEDDEQYAAAESPRLPRSSLRWCGSGTHESAQLSTMAHVPT